MTLDSWVSWPSREALTSERVSPHRRMLTWCVRLGVLGLLLWRMATERDVLSWQNAVVVLGLVACGVGGFAFYRTTLAHRLWPSVALLLLLMGAAIGAQSGGLRTLAIVAWCVCAVLGLERLPLLAAVPCTLVALAGYAVVDHDGWLGTAVTTVGLCLIGYVLRLDAEARGSARRLIAQERAALQAQAESAALTERARIAREIHDVLAHSLSAQLVHLEAARLLIERDGDRDQVHERVVAARSMAREGLAETRQALSALRGETVPVEDFLRELVRAAERAELDVTGVRRDLPAEASQTVRRVAQEAFTNVRKHAPGARVRLSLAYEQGEVALEVRDFGAERKGGGVLARSGSGYGLLGMRERAELLGGTLVAGPEEEGFVVRLRVPA